MTFKDTITVVTCSKQQELNEDKIDNIKSTLYPVKPVLNNFDKIKYISNLGIIDSKYCLSLLFKRSVKHLYISLSNSLLSIINVFNKFIKRVKHKSKLSLLTIKLNLPRLNKTAFLMSEFVFIFNNPLQNSKNLTKYF